MMSNFSVSHKPARGFTLIEIMVALFIVSFTVVAVIDVMGKHANITAELEKRLVASWVASNLIAQLRHDARINRVRERTNDETIELGGQRWRTTAEFAETEVERVFLLTVEVTSDTQFDSTVYATLTTAVTDRL